MKRVLVTGANGQLGQCLQELASIQSLSFVFLGSKDLDITCRDSVFDFFNNNIDYCVNCAAYTAVDKAESESDLANRVNVIGVENLSEACRINKVKLIHVSTDFVFDGNSNIPYLENVVQNPISEYGKTKLSGEKVIQEILSEYFILRTSWLYSEYSNNFVKTMLRLEKEREELSVVSDQIGSPTYAKDLAEVIIKIIKNDFDEYGVYHYSNKGVASWYDFAKAIFEIENSKIQVNPIPSTSFPTPAQRPKYSVLDTRKIQSSLGLDIPYWRDSLKLAISKM